MCPVAYLTPGVVHAWSSPTTGILDIGGYPAGNDDVAATIAAARTLRSLLYGVSPVDPLAIGAAVIVLLSASGLACYLPARRAAALDPTIALRHE